MQKQNVVSEIGMWKEWLGKHFDDLITLGLPLYLVQDVRCWNYFLEHGYSPESDFAPDPRPLFDPRQLAPDAIFNLLVLLSDSSTPESPCGLDVIKDLRRLGRQSRDWPRRVLEKERLIVRCDGTQIGETRTLGYDNIGMALGEFFPSDGYISIESLFLAFAAASLKNIDTTALEQERKEHSFELHTHDGCLMPIEWVYIHDYRKTHGIFDFQIEILLNGSTQADWRISNEG